MTRPTTLGELVASGWTSVPVAEELRRNAIARIRNGEPLVAEVLGYENTVLPQLENALLAGHDVIFLGERGQAKTRMIRSLTNLLDEWMPIVAGSEINDDPLNPISAHAKSLVAEHGDDTPIDWVHRDDRYGEKLATPDTSIADLIGEVDPIKVAEGRYLSDELTLHYGLVPRTNRGIFAMNELPDLSERIQVGLLNVLEERDVQIRGYKVRLPLDVVLFASANPEDYTNRGRIITPLKDRFGSQIRTHYPLDVETEMTIVSQEAVLPPADVVDVRVPEFMLEVIAEFSQQARESSQISQRSGVSVRLSVSNYEAIVANAVRRSLSAGYDVAVPRIGDLSAIAATTSGKIEVEAFEDGSEGKVIDALGDRQFTRRSWIRSTPCCSGPSSRRSRAVSPSTAALTWHPRTTCASSKRCLRYNRRSMRFSKTTTWTRPIPRCRHRRSSSSWRACTWASVSTRTPTADQPSTAAAVPSQLSSG